MRSTSGRTVQRTKESADGEASEGSMGSPLSERYPVSTVIGAGEKPSASRRRASASWAAPSGPSRVCTSMDTSPTEASVSAAAAARVASAREWPRVPATTPVKTTTSASSSPIRPLADAARRTLKPGHVVMLADPTRRADPPGGRGPSTAG